MKEGDQITARSPFGRKASVITLSQPPLSIFEGGVEDKELIIGTVHGRPVSFVERRSYLNFHYEKKWQAMKKAGLPVVPTVRLTSEGVLVTDLKADGSELYGFGWTPNDKPDEQFFVPQAVRPRPEIHPIFLNLTSPENFPSLKEKLYHYMEVANQNRILFSDDPGGAFRLLIRPDRSWTPILTDLVFIEELYQKIEKQLINNLGGEQLPLAEKERDKAVQEYIARRNRKKTEQSIEDLERIREYLLK